MKVMTVAIDMLIYGQASVLEGYQWGCMCGELYTNQEAAENCKKCRTYLNDTPDQVYYTPLP